MWSALFSFRGCLSMPFGGHRPLRKAMTKLDSVLKSRDITLPKKFHLVKAMVYPVVMYGCENWTIKKAEHQRINAFELWCWRRLLRVPWTARKSNQSILKEISPGYSLEGLMLKLKLQYFGHLIWRAYSWHHWLNGHEFEQTSGDSEGQGNQVCYSPWGCKESNITKWLNNNSKTIVYHICISSLKKNNYLVIVQA